MAQAAPPSTRFNRFPRDGAVPWIGIHSARRDPVTVAESVLADSMKASRETISAAGAAPPGR